MSKVIEYIKAAPLIAFSVVVLVIILWNFGELNDAVRIFLERAPEAPISIKYLGVEIGLDQAGVNRALFDVGAIHLTGPDRSKILRVIQQLTANEVGHLMQVGQLNNLCEYESPKSEMRMDVATDYALEKKQLTNIYPSPDTLEWVKGGQAEDVAHGKSPDIGPPRTCYEMTLTPTGYDVKTVLIHNLSVAFEGKGRATP